jgi:hypothetical protein
VPGFGLFVTIRTPFTSASVTTISVGGSMPPLPLEDQLTAPPATAPMMPERGMLMLTDAFASQQDARPLPRSLATS